MRPDIGSPGDGAAAAGFARHQQRMSALVFGQGGDQLDRPVDAAPHLVDAEDRRPRPADPFTIGCAGFG